MMWFYARLKRSLKDKMQGAVAAKKPEAAGKIIMRLLKLALPVSLSSLMLPVVANLDLLIVPQRLEAAGFSVGESTELFGYLTGMAVPLVNLATIFYGGHDDKPCACHFRIAHVKGRGRH